MKSQKLVCPVTAFYHLGRNGPISGSITRKGVHFPELCLFALLSCSKGIKTAFYKQHLHGSHFPYSSPPSSIFKCKVSSTLGWRELFWNHTSPFLSCLKYIYPWIDTRLETIQSRVDQLTGTGACSRACCWWAFAWILQHQLWLQKLIDWALPRGTKWQRKKNVSS